MYAKYGDYGRYVKNIVQKARERLKNMLLPLRRVGISSTELGTVYISVVRSICLSCVANKFMNAPV